MKEPKVPPEPPNCNLEILETMTDLVIMVVDTSKEEPKNLLSNKEKIQIADDCTSIEIELPKSAQDILKKNIVKRPDGIVDKAIDLLPLPRFVSGEDRDRIKKKVHDFKITKIMSILL